MPTDHELLATLKRSQDPDAMLLVQLAEHGSDLAKPHRPEFAFEVPSEQAAREVASILAAQGYGVETFEPDEDNPAYLVIASRLMGLDLEVLSRLSREFEALAEKYRGSYDGWGAEVVE